MLGAVGGAQRGQWLGTGSIVIWKWPWCFWLVNFGAPQKNGRKSQIMGESLKKLTLLIGVRSLKPIYNGVFGPTLKVSGGWRPTTWKAMAKLRNVQTLPSICLDVSIGWGGENNPPTPEELLPGWTSKRVQIFKEKSTKWRKKLPLQSRTGLAAVLLKLSFAQIRRLGSPSTKRWAGGAVNVRSLNPQALPNSFGL